MRPQDWPSMLDSYIEAARKRPFVWGAHDCVSFVCGWASLVSNVNAHAEFEGKYDSETSAFRVMHGHGVHTMEDAGDFLFGKLSRKAIARVQRGDVVLADDALGIAVGIRSAHLTVVGLSFIPFNKFQQVWGV